MFEEFIKIPLLIYRNYVKQHFGELKFTAEGKTSEAFVQMYGDLLFVAPADITADMIATHSDAQPLYHYVYNHQGLLSLYDKMSLPTWTLALKIVSLMLGMDVFKTT